MKEITKSQFKKLFFKHLTPESGWSRGDWKSLARDRGFEMKYMVEEPASSEHTRLYIVSDYGSREHRMFFMTLESDEALHEHPGHE
jgi:hypothetical protein